MNDYRRQSLSIKDAGRKSTVGCRAKSVATLRWKKKSVARLRPNGRERRTLAFGCTSQTQTERRLPKVRQQIEARDSDGWLTGYPRPTIRQGKYNAVSRVFFWRPNSQSNLDGHEMNDRLHGTTSKRLFLALGTSSICCHAVTRGTSSLAQMFCANVEHASYRRQTIVQPPAIYKQLHNLSGISEYWEHKELRCDGDRHPRKLCSLKPVALCGVRRHPHPSGFHSVVGS
ncbi:hypothetical protein P3T24_001774 [Paraburkholderia sp. GAS33]